MEATSFAEIEAEFIERVHSVVWCSVATLDTHNRLRSRVLHPIWEGATGWIATGRHTVKSKHLAHNPTVALTYMADPLRPVYVECHAEWADDDATKQRIWELFRTTPPPLGYDPALFFGAVDSPDFGVLRLTPWRIELADLFNPDKQRIWKN